MLHAAAQKLSLSFAVAALASSVGCANVVDGGFEPSQGDDASSESQLKGGGSATTTTTTTTSTTVDAPITGNGAPSGDHFNLNIIGVPRQKTAGVWISS